MGIINTIVGEVLHLGFAAIIIEGLWSAGYSLLKNKDGLGTALKAFWKGLWYLPNKLAVFILRKIVSWVRSNLDPEDWR